MAKVKIPEHPLLKKLVTEKKTDVTALQGYVGPSSTPGCIRVYATLDNLEESVEVAEADVLHYEKTPEGVLPHGAVTVWIKGDADVSVKLDRVADVGRVELRRGRLRIRVPGGGQMQVCQSVCGVCQSVCGVCQSVCGVCQSVCSAELAGPGQLRRPMGRFWR
jgi:hypothetical protein